MPVGTQILADDEERTLIADLDVTGKRVLLARGGNGGYDRQSHRIDPITLARAYRLVDTDVSANHAAPPQNS